MNNSCLICTEPLVNREQLYHTRCSRRFFGSSQAPLLPVKTEDLERLSKEVVIRSITVPGVQKKLSLQIDRRGKNDAGRFTIVGLWGSYILKPPIDEYPWMPETECATMHLAPVFGVATVPGALIPLQDGGLAYISRRIDRDPLCHMEDFCQLSDKLTEDKYRGSMEAAGKLIRRYCSNPILDMQRFFEIALFSFLTGNSDMHLKNFSLVYMPDGQIVLAPAYDLLATRLLASESDDPEEMALTMNGKKRALNRPDFDRFAHTLGINEKQYRAILRRFVCGLSQTAPSLGRSFLPADMITRFQALLDERATRLGLASQTVQPESH